MRGGVISTACVLWLVAMQALACSSDLPTLTECEPVGGVSPVCGFHNPEDLALLPGGGWILASQGGEMGGGEGRPGSLVGYRVADGRLHKLYPPEPGAAASSGSQPSPGWGSPECPGPPDPAVFLPHGVDVARPGTGARSLAVVNHGGRESIEFFEIGYAVDAPALFWRGCVLLPPEVWPNDVALLPGGGVMATNMMPGMRGAAAAWGIVKLLFGRDTGEVLEWRPDSGWAALPESAGSGPNGIAISPDGSEVYIAEWGRDLLVRLRRDEQGRTRRDSVALPHHPDNMTWTRDGRLLVTGQIGPIGDLMTCSRIETGTCGMPFSVVLVDPASLEVVPVLDSPTAVIGAGTVALEVGDEIFIGTFAGDRLARTSFHH